jgi:guanylate kinase
MFVVSGPSGAGKSTVLGRVLGALGDLHFSVSATTREPRAGEHDGTDYFFLSHEHFRDMIGRDDLLEYAEVHGQFYGTPAAFVREQLEAGRDVVLDLDVQGARKIRVRCPEATFIFLAPPSMEELAARLHGRHTETEERIQLRLGRAREELSAIREYDYLVVNETVAGAALRLQSIVEAERSRVERVIGQWPELGGMTP